MPGCDFLHKHNIRTCHTELFYTGRGLGVPQYLAIRDLSSLCSFHTDIYSHAIGYAELIEA
jgi:hypothetical protein